MRKHKEITENETLLRFINEQRAVIHKAECRIGNVVRNVRHFERVLNVVATHKPQYVNIAEAYGATPHAACLWALLKVNTFRDITPLMEQLNEIGVELEAWTSAPDSDMKGCVIYTHETPDFVMQLNVQLHDNAACEARVVGMKEVVKYITHTEQVPIYEYVCAEPVAQAEPQDENT